MTTTKGTNEMKTTMIRQGDVLLVRVDAKMSALDAAPQDPRGLVLAEGETSNHHHAVFGKGTRLCQYKTSGQRVVVVPRDCTDAVVRVVGGGAGGIDRHTPISLSPGKYEVRIQRAWTSERASRQVSD